mmetsp:Transcript_14306/g.39495  ORF Transcript_14306/g.39495 Transcript_14306/m.39495 type:complete len:137 (-) Transcript_14306:11-421(-)
MSSQYRTIRGVKYERDLLELAESEASGNRPISKAAAAKIWEQALDGNRVTPTERRTIEYILQEYKFTDAAKLFLESNLAGTAAPQAASRRTPSYQRSNSSYYKTIDTVMYDRKLLEQAEEIIRRDGAISLRSALKL